MGDSNQLNPDNEEASTSKLPFKRILLAVDRVVGIAIPLHVQKLKEHYDNIEVFEKENQWNLLHAEHISASNTVRLLKSDLQELELLRTRVKPEDALLFEKKVRTPTQEVIDTLSTFLHTHSEILQPLPEVSGNLPGSAVDQAKFPTLVCDPNAEPDNDVTPAPVISVQKLEDQILAEPLKFHKRWLKLKKDFIELNELLKKFANLVFSQRESVNTIEDNVLKAHENVQEGTKYLKKAVVLKAATIPVTGAVIGGLLLGPIGAFAGFKIFGSVACAVSGSVIGYGAGVKLKKKHLTSCDIEMKALTYSSKSHSVSTPELFPLSDDIAPNSQAVKARSLTDN